MHTPPFLTWILFASGRGRANRGGREGCGTATTKRQRRGKSEGIFHLCWLAGWLESNFLTSRRGGCAERREGQRPEHVRRETSDVGHERGGLSSSTLTIHLLGRWGNGQGPENSHLRWDCPSMLTSW